MALPALEYFHSVMNGGGGWVGKERDLMGEVSMNKAWSTHHTSHIPWAGACPVVTLTSMEVGNCGVVVLDKIESDFGYI